MLKIIVLGNGLIPRGLGLAPRKEPINADLNLIQLILSTPGLKVKMLHPEDGHLVDLTKSNLTSNWQKYSNYKKSGANQESNPQKTKEAKTPVETKVDETKGTPITPNVPVITKQAQEEKKEDAAETKPSNDEEKKENQPAAQNQNQNNKNQGYQNNKQNRK